MPGRPLQVVLVGGVMAVSGLLASCSLIVQFHDQSLPDGGGDCTGALCIDAAIIDGSLPDDTGAPPGPDVVTVDAGPPPKDAAPAPDHYAPCLGLHSGYYCANDGPNAYAGPPTDLLYCLDGGIGRATPCDGGCLKIPDPFPDACNPCPGIKNGLYCGRDLPGFPADNADFLLQCQNGDTVQQVACLHGCGSNGAMSACF